MTRYPVHVGSIPAYALAEMDRINAPYRKERAMTDDPGEREAALKARIVSVIEAHAACSHAAGEEICTIVPDLLEALTSDPETDRWFNIPEHMRASPDPVSEPVDGLRKQYARQSKRAADDIATWPDWMQHNLTPPTVPVNVGLPDALDEYYAARHSKDADRLAEAIDAVADALNGWDQGEEPREDTHRHWSRIVAALAAAPAEERGGVDAIARLAIDYVEDTDAAWQEAKDTSETDDDLEPSWVAFRDAVRAARQSGDPR